MSQKSFILYHDYSKLINKLNDTQLAQLVRAVFHYEITGELLQLDAITDMAMTTIKLNLDRNREKYEKIVEKRIDAGSKGGKQKQANANKSKQVQASASKCKQNLANVAVNENVNVNVNVNDNDITKPPKVPLTGDVKFDFKFFYENVPIWFNTILHELPGVTTIESRKSVIKARCSKLKTEREWKVFFLWIKKSDFLMGQIQTRSHENFKVTFDWILKLSNFIKIIEGNYHERQRIMINDIQIKNYYLFLNNITEEETKQCQ